MTWRAIPGGRHNPKPYTTGNSTASGSFPRVAFTIRFTTLGRAVQVDPIKLILKAPKTKCSKL